MYFRFAVLVSGMRIKKIIIGNLTIAYGERGSKKKGQSSILLLHGFSADKFMWSGLVGVIYCYIDSLLINLCGQALLG